MLEKISLSAKIKYSGESYSFHDIGDKVSEISRRMRATAVNRRIALQIDSPLESIFCFLAGCEAGLSVYLLHPDSPIAKIMALQKLSVPIINRIDNLNSIEVDDYSKNTAHFSDIILSTSNTTKSNIKWVQIPYKFLEEKSVMLQQMLGINSQDITFLFSPICFIQSCWTLLSHLFAGGTVYVDSFDYKRIPDILFNENITTLITVPSIVRSFMKDSIRPEKIRLLCIGGDYADCTLIDALSERWPNVKYSNVYGCTETSAADIILPPMLLGEKSKKLYSIGKSGMYSNITLRSLSEPSQIVTEGIIWITGSMVNPEYVGIDAPVEYGFNTGDIAFCDDDGYYYFVSRKSGLIKYNGNRVSCIEVERCMQGYPQIRDVIVFGESHPIYGEIVSAAIFCTNSVQEDELILYLTEQLEKYKIPQRIYVVASELKRTVSGKLCRQKEIVNGYISNHLYVLSFRNR